MWLLILEALLALSILLFAVWWTMFSGRKREDPGADPPAESGPGQAPGPGRDPGR